MGKKAKLKKIRRELKATLGENSQGNPHNFVKQIEQRGYHLQQSQRSPEVPRDNIEPQL
ncbi:MAG TPA: hypothetical protein ACFCUY_06345 [Xenococcaceae cyanobacterium]|jgi:uncharacterized protein Veg